MKLHLKSSENDATQNLISCIFPSTKDKHDHGLKRGLWGFFFRMLKINRINTDSNTVTNAHRFLCRQSHEVIGTHSIWLILHKQTGSLGPDWSKELSVKERFTSSCRALVSYWSTAPSAPTCSPLTGQTATLPN